MEECENYITSGVRVDGDRHGERQGEFGEMNETCTGGSGLAALLRARQERGDVRGSSETLHEAWECKRSGFEEPGSGNSDTPGYQWAQTP